MDQAGAIMNYPIELYRDAAQTFHGTIPFLEIVRQSLQSNLRFDLSQLEVQVTIVNVPHQSHLYGQPILENLVPEFGYAYVVLSLHGRVVYQHPHTLEDIMGRRLQVYLHEKYPEVQQWGFRVDVPGMPSACFERKAPPVQGGIWVGPSDSNKRPAFGIQRLAGPPLPACALSDFKSIDSRGNAKSSIKVLLPAELDRQFLCHRPMSSQVEEGGFLIGRAYADADDPTSFLVVVTEGLNAEHTGASLWHFTFTGDSFAHAKQVVRSRQPGERIVGWYHTHLFPATETFGLSSIDVTLHFGTFTFPWQLAGLINIDRGERTLRFYVRKGAEMVECRYWCFEGEAPFHSTLAVNAVDSNDGTEELS